MHIRNVQQPGDYFIGKHRISNPNSCLPERHEGTKRSKT
jgi:hypothetical protein